jgi:hypothetical protein
VKEKFKMFGRTWNHDTLRKYVILFGTLFNDIWITRDNRNGESIQTIRVPLSYGPKEKFLARLEGNPDFSNKVGIVLPRISFEMTSFTYDSERKLNTLNKHYRQPTNNGTDDRIAYQYAPVPYNITFQMSIMVKNAEDGTRIIEQILPYFTPEWTATVNLIPEIGAVYDIPIILNDVSVTDTYEGSFEERRAIVWNLTFTMKAYVFGPTKKSGLIKFVEGNIHTNLSQSSNAALTVTAQPGLTANGQPTSNAELSIDYLEIKSTDNYGFINDFIEKF